MRKTYLRGEPNNRNGPRYGQITALAFCVFLAVCISPFFVQPVRASPNWISTNGCWTATTGNQTLVMWNTTGLYTWKAPAAMVLNKTWYLVVAGGGAGGGTSTTLNRGGSGGGAGGFLNGTITLTGGSTYYVAVGTGGTAVSGASGTSGSNSSFENTTPVNGIQAMGGGHGSYDASGGNGGSGGGEADGGTAVGTSIAGQGMNGGTNSGIGAGGGGGGTAAGSNGATPNGGKGGNGNTSAITGTSTTYAGGGGGGSGRTGTTTSTGGTGGGGNGGTAAGGAGNPGTINTGGGGGGASSAAATAYAGGGGGSGIVIISYYVWNQTISGFTGTPTSGLYPLTVQFNLTSMNNNATYVNWTWGDGSASSNQTGVANFNQSHTYGSNGNGGTFTVIESAADPYYTNITSLSNYITVYNKTVSGFTGTPTSGVFPLTVQFNLTSMNNNATYVNWTWGDGTVSNTTLPLTNFNASHIYSSGGTYTVNESAANPYFTNITSLSNYITVYNKTVSGFTNSSSTPTSGVFPLTVQFNRTVPNDNATMWNWSFGDNIWYNTTLVSSSNATHTYSSGGTYTVNETAANTYYTNITSLSNYITVYNTTISGFTGTPASGVFPLAVQFNLTSMNNNATYVNWTWGDGTVSNTSTLQTFNASHIYSSGGTYTVNESAANPYFTNITSLSNYITVYNQTASGFTSNVTYGHDSFAVQFNRTIPNDNATMWNWSFGDNTWYNTTLVSLSNATHTYSSGSSYTVSESAANPYNISIDTQSNYISPYVAISLNESAINLALIPGSSATNASLGITVSANAQFAISVSDSSVRPTSYAGHMENYTSGGYGNQSFSGQPGLNTTLASYIQLTGTTNGTTVEQSLTPYYPIPAYPSADTLYSGSASVTNQLLAPNTFTQPVAFIDPVLPSGSTYRIDLVYTVGLT